MSTIEKLNDTQHVVRGEYNGALINGKRSFWISIYSRQVGGLSRRVKGNFKTLEQAAKVARAELKKQDKRPIKDGSKILRCHY